jgi:hypothetical protein
VDVWVPFARRALIKTTLTTDLVYYARFASERSIDPGVRVRGEVFLNRITLFAEPSRRRTRQRLNYEVDARAAREEEGIAAGASVRLSRAITMELGTHRGGLRFDGDETFNGTSLQETLNRTTDAASAALRVELTPLTAFVLRAERASDRFDLSPVRDADSVRIVPGLEFKPAALIAGTASVGFRRFTPRSASLAPFRGLVANAALDYTLGDSTRFAFTADRDVTYSYEPVQPYFVAGGYGLEVARRLVGRTDVAVGASWHRYSYRNLAGSAPADRAREDSLRTVSASVGYRVGRVRRLGFGLLHHRRHSNNATHRDYEGLRLMATAEYGF